MTVARTDTGPSFRGWRVIGLYSDDEMFEGCTMEEARRRYHDRFPGFEGTILDVEVVFG